MAMSKNDYELIADVFKMLSAECVLHREKTLLGRAATAMANRMASRNPTFNTGKFLQACSLPKIEGWNC